MRILMATDGSERSIQSLTVASRIFSPANRAVDLMCVVPKVADHRLAHRERLQRRARHVVEQTKAALADERVVANAAIGVGSPARLLVGASRNYDVTVVAALSDVAGPMAGLGPIASRVAEHAHGAVLIAREAKSEEGIRILAAVDGSESSTSALRLMSDLVDLREAEITLVYVAETPWLHAGPDQEWLGYEEKTEVQIDPQARSQGVVTKEGQDVLIAAREQLSDAAITTVMREGIPAEEILSETENGSYDLVVVGASGSSDMKHKILGSVSAKVAWNAPCSVLLVGPAAERE